MKNDLQNPFLINSGIIQGTNRHLAVFPSIDVLTVINITPVSLNFRKFSTKIMILASIIVANFSRSTQPVNARVFINCNWQCPIINNAVIGVRTVEIAVIRISNYSISSGLLAYNSSQGWVPNVTIANMGIITHNDIIQILSIFKAFLKPGYIQRTKDYSEMGEFFSRHVSKTKKFGQRKILITEMNIMP